MTKITLRRIFSKHVLLKRTQFQLTQANLQRRLGPPMDGFRKLNLVRRCLAFFSQSNLQSFSKLI